MVDKSCIGSCDEVTRLVERVESTFIMHFSKGNHKKGINTPRPQARRERHRVTYFLALVVVIVELIQARDLLKSEACGQYMENIFPLYRYVEELIASLHLFLISSYSL